MEQKIEITVQVNLQNLIRTNLNGGALGIPGVDERIILNWVFKK
jgi:hypothetical protein